MKEPLFLGVASEIITPSVGVDLFGYVPRPSTSVNDDLTVTALYFRQANTDALMISATLCSIKTEFAEYILTQIEERFGIPADRCMIHATHTHSGPIASGGAEWESCGKPYCEQILFPKLMEAVEKAKNAAVEVVMGVHTGESYVGINRRELTVENEVILGQNPWGVFNPKMTVISFQTPQGKSVANIIHYGCHGTAAGKNAEITRDWSGVMTDELHAVSGGMTAFFNGPEGDIGPRMPNGKTMGDHHVRYALELGTVAARDAVQIYKEIAEHKEVTLETSCKTLCVPLASRVPLAQAEKLYEEYQNGTSDIKDDRVGHYYNRVAQSYRNGYEDLLCRSFKQTVIRLGDVAFVSFPYEIFSEIGMRIVQVSDIPFTLSLSNTNGAEGYFVTADQICRGGYEVDMFKIRNLQPYAENTDFYLVKETLSHLKELCNKGE